MSTIPQEQNATIVHGADSEGRAMVRSYIAAGMHCLPLVPRGKQAFQDGWSTAPFDEEAFWSVIDKRQGHNVGVRLDGDLIDLDFDRPEARQLSGYFFPEAPAFRRASLPAAAPGHRILRCSNPTGKAVKFQFTGPNVIDEAKSFFGKPEHLRQINDPKPKLCICEIRNGAGAQTGFPPSVYDNGRGRTEALVWNDHFDPAKLPVLPYEEIHRRSARLAFASMALRAYPQAAGSRDEYCLKLAGALLALGFDGDDGDNLIVHIARLAGDEEADQRGGKVAHTLERREAGEQVSGLPSFLEYIGFATADRTVRKWFALKRPATSKPQAADGSISMETEVHERSQRLTEELKRLGAYIYIRAGQLVQVRIWGEEGEHEAKVQVAGSPVPVKVAYADISLLNAHTLRMLASKAGIRYSRRDRNGNEWPEPNPSLEVFQDVIKTPNEWGFPQLRGLSLVPTLTRQEPGFDAATGLFLAFPKNKFPPLPERPTKADADAALARLLAPVRAYEWENEVVDKAVFASAVIAAAIRASTRGLFPAFSFDALKRGSGKTKLAVMSCSFANGGVRPPISSWNPSPQEFGKALFASLLGGATSILYDNVTCKVGGAEIEGMLTAGESGWKSRLLGASEDRYVPADAFIAITGNRLQYSTDMTRRALRCGLDPKVDFPEERTFDFDPVEEMLADFPARVIDVLTVLRAFQLSGQRVQAINNDFSGFRRVQHALVWLGMADPLTSMLSVRERDADGEQRALTLEWLYRKFENREFRAWQVAHDFEQLKAAGMVPGNLERSSMTPAAICGTIISSLKGAVFGGLAVVEEKRDSGKVYRIEGSLEPVPKPKDSF